MERIDRIGPRREVAEGVYAIAATRRVERRERDPERRERDPRRRPPRPPDGPVDHGAEPGHIDVSA
ncbi:MAG TPA: hypothetical protein VFR97_03395 [Capillimicrobium sp.]|nr:hypothetical protein [Capillimicrobium sp.]